MLDVLSRQSALEISGHGRHIAVIGLGYVGLPVAAAFAASGAPTIGFDIDSTRIGDLCQGRDRMRTTNAADLVYSEIAFTNDPKQLEGADFFIVAVPTPVDSACRPDMTAVIRASETVAHALSPSAIVVYESTVYPGATEEECIPVLERGSGLVCGRDFTVGYSPERINPGDPIHRFDRVTKVVAAQDEQTLDIVADVYGSVVKTGIYRAPSIKVAEAAKVLENTQRDLNIALMNEFALICRRIGIDTGDVIDAARTKWNFMPFTPGLVGGHCIGVDPYYLAHKATMCGYLPEMILAGRRINDRMAEFVAQECIRLLASRGLCQAHVAVLGITFKENVRDIRNTKTVDIVRRLEGHGYKVSVHDPLSDPAEAGAAYGLNLKRLKDINSADAVILTVPHRQFVAGSWKLVQRCLKDGKGIVLDVRSCLDRGSIPEGIELWRM